MTANNISIYMVSSFGIEVLQWSLVFHALLCVCTRMQNINQKLQALNDNIKGAAPSNYYIHYAGMYTRVQLQAHKPQCS